MDWRSEPREGDLQAVATLIAASEFFSEAELAVAVELVEEALNIGAASGYNFVFVDDTETPDQLLAYSCYGPIPDRETEFDLYWIAVSPRHQGAGWGSRLLLETERRVRLAGATHLIAETSGRTQYAPTRAFYQRMGYTCAEVVENYYAPGDDKVVYQKNI